MACKTCLLGYLKTQRCYVALRVHKYGGAGLQSPQQAALSRLDVSEKTNFWRFSWNFYGIETVSVVHYYDYEVNKKQQRIFTFLIKKIWQVWHLHFSPLHSQSSGKTDAPHRPEVTAPTMERRRHRETDRVNRRKGKTGQ